VGREHRGPITETVVDLRLGEILNVPQVRPFQIRLCEDGAAEIRIIKNCMAQISSLEIGAVQPRIGEVSAK
jgi:hypothetical protein